MPPRAKKPPVDLSWFEEHLLEDILPHWLEAAPTESGLFLPQLDREWQRGPERYGTIVSQSRLLYNFSVGYKETGDERYAEAVERGAAFLLDRFRDPKHEGWFFACAEDGSVVDDAKDSYGHAFLVFGFAHAAECLEDDTYTRAALDAWEVLTGALSDGYGGLIPRTTRDFSARADARRAVNSQNPMMHFFEALLTFGDSFGLEQMHYFAQDVHDFLFARAGHVAQHGLPELYAQNWSPLPTAEGGRVDIGHQFEWAFLLSAAVERDLPQAFFSEALGLLDYGLKVGCDAGEGGIFADASLEGEVIRPDKGWWQQCEAARAMMHFAVLRGCDDLWDPLERTLDFIRRELVDPEYGGWYAGPGREKGSPWKVDYHVVGMCQEAMRLSKIAGGRQ